MFICDFIYMTLRSNEISFMGEEFFFVFLSEGERQGYINEGFLDRVGEGGGEGYPSCWWQ